MNAVDVKQLKQNLCALWDVIIEAQDQIATILDVLEWPKTEEENRRRAWLFRAGEPPIEITLADYYAAAKGVERNA